MLVLSRKVNEQILIDGDIRITVVMIRGNQVRIGIEAPADVAIFRKELCDAAPPSAAADRDDDEPMVGSGAHDPSPWSRRPDAPLSSRT
jgi:carbon storage regulator